MNGILNCNPIKKRCKNIAFTFFSVNRTDSLILKLKEKNNSDDVDLL